MKSWVQKDEIFLKVPEKIVYKTSKRTNKLESRYIGSYFFLPRWCWLVEKKRRKKEEATNLYYVKHEPERIFSNSSSTKTGFLSYSHYIPNKLYTTI